MVVVIIRYCSVFRIAQKVNVKGQHRGFAAFWNQVIWEMGFKHTRTRAAFKHSYDHLRETKLDTGFLDREIAFHQSRAFGCPTDEDRFSHFE